MAKDEKNKVAPRLKKKTTTKQQKNPKLSLKTEFYGLGRFSSAFQLQKEKNGATTKNRLRFFLGS